MFLRRQKTKCLIKSKDCRQCEKKCKILHSLIRWQMGLVYSTNLTHFKWMLTHRVMNKLLKYIDIKIGIQKYIVNGLPLGNFFQCYLKNGKNYGNRWFQLRFIYDITMLRLSNKFYTTCLQDIVNLGNDTLSKQRDQPRSVRLIMSFQYFNVNEKFFPLKFCMDLKFVYCGLGTCCNS